jgi:hypothetical protein
MPPPPYRGVHYNDSLCLQIVERAVAEDVSGLNELLREHGLGGDGGVDDVYMERVWRSARPMYKPMFEIVNAMGIVIDARQPFAIKTLLACGANPNNVVGGAFTPLERCVNLGSGAQVGSIGLLRAKKRHS